MGNDRMSVNEIKITDKDIEKLILLASLSAVISSEEEIY